jgi:hypothetical protein
MFLADQFSLQAVLPVDIDTTNFAEVGTGPGGNRLYDFGFAEVGTGPGGNR